MPTWVVDWKTAIDEAKAEAKQKAEEAAQLAAAQAQAVKARLLEEGFSLWTPHRRQPPRACHWRPPA